MKKIVITGGVGSGKSEVMKYLEDNYKCKVVRADDVAKKLMRPGQTCYYAIIEAFPNEDLLIDQDEVQDGNDIDGRNDKSHIINESPFDKGKLSALVFADEKKRAKINSIVHPAVKQYILDDIRAVEDEYEYYFLETALAIEEGYDKLFDETWYIHSSQEVRRDRLKRNRGYSEDRIDEIFKSQQSDEEFRLHATVIIDNDVGTTELYNNIVKALP